MVSGFSVKGRRSKSRVGDGQNAPSGCCEFGCIGILPIKLVAPITEWKAHFKNNIWHVRVDPDHHNGLTKSGAIDALQLRTVDFSRFADRLGYLSAAKMDEVVAAIAVVIEYQ